MKKITKTIPYEIKPKFQTPYNRDHDHDKERPSENPTRTVPALALTVRQEAVKIRQGVPHSAARKLVFDPDGSLPNIKELDLTEQKEMLAFARDSVRRLTALKKQQDEDLLTEQQNKILAERAQLIKDLQKEITKKEEA